MQPQETTKMIAPQSAGKIRLMFYRDAEVKVGEKIEQYRAGQEYEVESSVAQEILQRVYQGPYTFSGERPVSEAERKPIRVAEMVK